MDYLEALSKLNKKQKKDILNIIAEDRIDEYGVAGKAANLGDRAFSILGGSGNNIRLNPTEEEKFISLAMESLKPKRKGKAEGGSLLDDDMPMSMSEDMPETEEQETHMMPDGTEMPGATHGEYEEDMVPDGEMEQEYSNFIINEALTPEEEDMLVSKLEQDEELSMIFDKVIDVAQEFAGNGPVEGPGTGVSDSIPARLSDGEFVFTAKAVEEIGEDTLMSMMNDAEVAADKRQQVYNGGTVGDQLEKVVQTETRIMKPLDNSSPALGLAEDNLIQEEVTRNMLDPRVPHVRS